MKINTAEYITSGTREEHFPVDDKYEYLLCGRSNVGKSSFINAFLGKKNLAYTSSKPGKTQTLSYFLINDSFYFVDVPGYGYAKVSKTKREEFGQMIEAYLTSRKQLRRVILLIDFRHPPSKDDILMYDFLKYYNIACTIVCTKKDKTNKTQFNNHLKQITSSLNVEDGDNLFVVSSETKDGFEEVSSFLFEDLNNK